MMRRRSWLCLSLAGLVACGSVKTGSLPDAPPAPGDTGGDPTDGNNAGDASLRGTVRVTVLDPAATGAPAVGANVAFIDPDGTLVKRLATDTNGKASADVLPGASVTSVAVVGTSSQIITVLAVKPGDDLVMGNKSLDTTMGTFTVNFPLFPNAAAGQTISYAVSGPCGAVSGIVPGPNDTAVSATVTVLNHCKQDTMEIVVTAQDTTTAAVLGVLDKPGVVFVNNGVVTMPTQYQSARNFTATYTNVNPIITSLGMSRAVPDGFGVLNAKSVTTPTASVAVSLTGGVGAGARIETSVLNAGRSIQRVRQNIAGSAASYGLDVGATLLSWLPTPSYDAATRTLVVPTDSTGVGTAKPDAFRIIANYRRTDATTNVISAFNWTIYGPDAVDITLPVLPPELGDIAPTADDTVSANDLMFDAEAAASYDAVRGDLSQAFVVFQGARPPGNTTRISASPSLRQLP